jgi:hypothetical protein
MKWNTTILCAGVILLIVLMLVGLVNYRETFDTLCAWKRSQSALISLDILQDSSEYTNIDMAKTTCAADENCSGILSMTAADMTSYKLMRTKPNVTNTNENLKFIEKSMCRSGTNDETSNKGLRTSLNSNYEDDANAAGIPIPDSPPEMLNLPRSGVVAIPAVGPPPMPAKSTLGSTVGQSGMLGTNPPGPVR